MLAELKPYPEYKDEQWPGAVPAHWQLRRAKYVLREIDERWTERTGQLLSVSQYTGVTKRRLREGSDEPATRSETLEGYKVVATNDLAVNIMLAWNGSLGVAPFDGVVSPAYCVYRFRDGNPWYFHSLLRSPDYRAEIKRRSRGVVESRLRLYSDDLFRVPLLVPPPAEQAGIVRFLGAVDRKVNRFIRAKRRLIEVLTEQKQAIITHAVTKGLNPHAPGARVKPSGIDWLGDVPAHWDVRRCVRLFRERVERGREGLPILSVSLNTGVTISGELDEDGRPRRLIEDVAQYKYTAKGDIAYNTMRMWQGAVGVVPTDGLVSPAYVVAVPRVPLSADFYSLLFHTDRCLQEFNRQSRGIVTDRNRLYWDEFKQVPLPVPPLDEQTAIVQWIAEQTREIEQSIDVIRREIDLIREYRTWLVADVVTGKVDVRAAAASIPDEPSDVAAGDQSGEILDGEGDDAEAGDVDAEDAAPPPEEVEA